MWDALFFLPPFFFGGLRQGVGGRSGLTRDDEGEVGDGAVEDAVQPLQRGRPPSQQWPSSQPVGAGVQGGKGKVEGQSPVGQVGEEGKGLAGAAQVLGAAPAKVENGRDKGIERQQGAESEEQAGRQQPRGCEAVGRVEGSVGELGKQHFWGCLGKKVVGLLFLPDFDCFFSFFFSYVSAVSKSGSTRKLFSAVSHAIRGQSCRDAATGGRQLWC